MAWSWESRIWEPLFGVEWTVVVTQNETPDSGGSFRLFRQ